MTMGVEDAFRLLIDRLETAAVSSNTLADRVFRAEQDVKIMKTEYSEMNTDLVVWKQIASDQKTRIAALEAELDGYASRAAEAEVSP